MNCSIVDRRSAVVPNTHSIKRLCEFFQPGPSFIEKTTSNSWKTRHHSLSGEKLRQKAYDHADPTSDLSIGTLSKWYPEYLELDIDRGGFDMCKILQKSLQLQDDQVQFCKTERKNGYRLRCRVDQETSTATREYFYQKLKFLENAYGAEVYPRASKHVRLPFDSKLTPVGRTSGLDVNALIEDFQNLQPLNLDYLSWPSEKASSWKDPEEEAFCRPFLSAAVPVSRSKGEFALQHGLSGPGQRYATQWSMLKILHQRGWTANTAYQEVLKSFSQGYISRDVRDFLPKVQQELQWCCRAIWNGEQLTDYIRQDALKFWAAHSEADFPFLRFVLGVVSYLTARYAPGREIPMHSKVLRAYAHPRNVKSFLQRLEEMDFIRREASYQPGSKSKCIVVQRPELLGIAQPIFSSTIPLGGLEALARSPEIYEDVYSKLSRVQKGSMSTALHTFQSFDEVRPQAQ